MFPSAEQVERNGGKAVVRIYFRFCPVDSMYGGVSLNPRGTSIKGRTGPVGASISDYGHTIRLGIPGMYGFNFGEDYTYGLTASVGYSPVVGHIGDFRVRAGGKVDVFHSSPVALGAVAGALAGLGATIGGVDLSPRDWVLLPAAGAAVVGTVFPYVRKMARGISLTCDFVYRPIVNWLHRAAHRVGLAQTEPQTTEEGWPISERWRIARRSVDAAEHACRLASERAEMLAQIPPSELCEAVGLDHAASLLGLAAERPEEVHATITQYLDTLRSEVAVEAEQVREMCALALEGTRINKKHLNRLSASLEHRAAAFAFVDALVGSLLEPLQGRERRALAV
jgi:hypothetical protein